MKEECKYLGGMIHPIAIPKWKHKVISMEFITGFLKTVREHNYIMVMVDMLMKVSHFILVKSTFSASDVARVFI